MTLMTLLDMITKACLFCLPFYTVVLMATRKATNTQQPAAAVVTHSTASLQGSSAKASVQASEDNSSQTTPVTQLVPASNASSQAPMSTNPESAVLKHDQAGLQHDQAGDGDTSQMAQHSTDGSSPAQATNLVAADTGNTVRLYMCS